MSEGMVAHVDVEGDEAEAAPERIADYRPTGPSWSQRWRTSAGGCRAGTTRIPTEVDLRCLAQRRQRHAAID